MLGIDCLCSLYNSSHHSALAARLFAIFGHEPRRFVTLSFGGPTGAFQPVITASAVLIAAFTRFARVSTIGVHVTG